MLFPPHAFAVNSRAVRRGLPARLGFALLLCGLALSPPARGATLSRPASVHGAGLHGTTNGRSPGYLGIEFHDAPLTPAALTAPSAPRGVEVVMVDHDGPAGKAGLRPHDVIVSLNGQLISSADALKRMIHDAGAGVQVALNVLRNGHSMTLNAQLATRDEVARAAMARLAASSAVAPQPMNLSLPETEIAGEEVVVPTSPPAPAGSPPLPPPHSQGFLSSMLHSGSSTGIMLDVMEPQLALYFGAPQGTGLLVQSVDGGSVGAMAGLRAGDVVLRVDMYPLRTQADWTKRLHAAKGRPLTLSVLRERREMTLTLQTDYKHHSLLEWPARF